MANGGGGAVSFLIRDRAAEKITRAIAENDYAETARQIAEAEREDELRQAELKKFRREFWENLRVRFVIEFSSDDELFMPTSFEDQLAAGDYPHPSLVLRRFCLCAAQFYQSKGCDISDVKVIGLQNKLERDGFADEFFFDEWVIFLVRNVAAHSLSSALQVVYRRAGCETDSLRYPGSELRETGGEFRPGADDEIWDEMLEENHH